jgi:hypothetical protein
MPPIRNAKFRCLSEAIPYYHNVFTFTLFIPEGRAGVAWEPSNKIMLFLPLVKDKVSLTSPLDFIFESTLNVSFPISLSLGFKGLNVLSNLCIISFFVLYKARHTDPQKNHGCFTDNKGWEPLQWYSTGGTRRYPKILFLSFKTYYLIHYFGCNLFYLF